MTSKIRKGTFLIGVIISMELVAWSADSWSSSSASIGETVITSKTLLFDYRQRMCVFEGDVVVIEPRVRMESQKLHVFFDASNNVESVVATEAVKVIQDNRVASCGQAVYTAESGAIVMTIDPVLARGRDELRGDVIKIFVNSAKVISKPGRLVVYPSDVKKPIEPQKQHQ